MNASAERGETAGLKAEELEKSQRGANLKGTKKGAVKRVKL